MHCEIVRDDMRGRGGAAWKAVRDDLRRGGRLRRKWQVPQRAEVDVSSASKKKACQQC
jgi:hypothetical protein